MALFFSWELRGFHSTPLRNTDSTLPLSQVIREIGSVLTFSFDSIYFSS